MNQNYISELKRKNSGAGVIELDVNKTLIVDQYNTNPRQLSTEEPWKNVVEAGNMKDVFTKFKPEVNVTFEDGERQTEETLRFNEMKDFDVNGGNGNLVKNSVFLSSIKSNMENADKVKDKIQHNSTLRKILDDPSKRNALLAYLESMKTELEASL